MTSLVTIDDYQRITRDTTTADNVVQPQLDAAEELVAEYLRRPGRLAQGSYTDRLRIYPLNGGWVVYPIATPVTAVGGGLTVLNPRTVGGVTPDGSPLVDWPAIAGTQPFATVTYTGGWTAQTLPETVRREIAKLARAAVTAPATTVPAGATSVRLGDAAVTFGDASSIGAELPASARSVLRRYMRRRAA